MMAVKMVFVIFWGE